MSSVCRAEVEAKWLKVSKFEQSRISPEVLMVSPQFSPISFLPLLGSISGRALFFSLD